MAKRTGNRARGMTVEALEARLTMSAVMSAGEAALPSVLKLGQEVQGSGAIVVGLQASVGGAGTTVLGGSLTNIAVDSYTGISNCALEYQGGLPDIGYVSEKGAYVEYTVTAATAGTYTINLGLASYSGAQVGVSVNGGWAGMLSAPANKSWTNYVTGTGSVDLAAGTNVIRLTSLNGTQYNLNSVGLAPVASRSNGNGSVTRVGDYATLDVAAFSGIWKSQLEYQGGKADIGYVSANGAYVEYTIEVQNAGTYTVALGVAAPGGAMIDVSAGGESVGTIYAGGTGSWGTFADATAEVALEAGVQTLRFTATAWSQYNLGSINLSRRSAVSAPAPLPASTLPAASVTQRWMASFNEIDVVGSSGGDTIVISQAGGTVTIVSNGHMQELSVASGELAIWGGGGDDHITVDSSVTLDTRVYGGEGDNVLEDYTQGQATIVSLGAGWDNVTGNRSNTSYWVDASDVVNASAGEKAIGGVHVVGSFWGGAATSLNSPNLADPISNGSGWTRLSNNSLFGLGASQEDINQGQVSDCYLLTALQSLARLQPGSLRQMGVDLGDGTYAIQFKRNGVTSFVRVDGDLPTSSWGSVYYAHPGASGNQWAAIFEKAYAFFRSGAGSYSSLNYGFMTAAYNDLGVGATTITLPTDQNAFFATTTAKLSAGKSVDVGTNAKVQNGAPLISGHAYSVVSVTKDWSGTVWVTLRNPWGSDGAGVDGNAWDGLVTMTYGTLQGAATYATTVN